MYRGVRVPWARDTGSVRPLFYEATALAAYAVGFVLLMHLFVVLYEEPALAATFGREYQEYCRRVSRWWPWPRA